MLELTKPSSLLGLGLRVWVMLSVFEISGLLSSLVKSSKGCCKPP